MGSQRDAFGRLPAFRYKVGTARCNCGRSFISEGCGLPATRWYRFTGRNGGPVGLPEFIGRCDEHPPSSQYTEVGEAEGSGREAEIVVD